jgi:hypothetical protein
MLLTVATVMALVASFAALAAARRSLRLPAVEALRVEGQQQLQARDDGARHATPFAGELHTPRAALVNLTPRGRFAGLPNRVTDRYAY